uniref:Holin n=1 Tax=viral metagenome TaxID=1070528 RepID=A0A6C0KE87_9ZZZZ
MNQLLILFFGLLVFNIIIPIIMNFLSVSASDYVNIVLWINAIAIFYSILPDRVGKIFKN